MGRVMTVQVQFFSFRISNLKQFLQQRVFHFCRIWCEPAHYIQSKRWRPRCVRRLLNEVKVGMWITGGISVFKSFPSTTGRRDCWGRTWLQNDHIYNAYIDWLQGISFAVLFIYAKSLAAASQCIVKHTPSNVYRNILEWLRWLLNRQRGRIYHWSQCCGGCSWKSIASLVDTMQLYWNTQC